MIAWEKPARALTGSARSAATGALVIPPEVTPPEVTAAEATAAGFVPPEVTVTAPEVIAAEVELAKVAGTDVESQPEHYRAVHTHLQAALADTGAGAGTATETLAGGSSS